jgi:hypothetical protein
MKRPSVNLSAAVKLLGTISLDHLRGSDRSLLRFMELCRHWQVLSRDEVNRRVAEARHKNKGA